MTMTVSVVMRMGRKRSLPASTRAARSSVPSLCRDWTTSSRRMAVFVTKPIRMTKPSTLLISKAVPVR